MMEIKQHINDAIASLQKVKEILAGEAYAGQRHPKDIADNVLCLVTHKKTHGRNSSRVH